MNIYRLNDIEWYMAPSLEEAITAAINLTGLTREEVFDSGSGEPLNDAALDRLRYVDDDPEGDEPEDGWPSRTFREELAARVAAGDGAGIFATSEY